MLVEPVDNCVIFISCVRLFLGISSKRIHLYESKVSACMCFVCKHIVSYKKIKLILKKKGTL